jgi:hypothetical protein
MGPLQIDKKANCLFFGKDSINCVMLHYTVAEYPYHCAWQPGIGKKCK